MPVALRVAREKFALPFSNSLDLLLLPSIAGDLVFLSRTLPAGDAGPPFHVPRLVPSSLNGTAPSPFGVLPLLSLGG